jgi:2-amino-4-hydroxy-6-hydroxymethyldihydropteridine diphosphokinase
MILIGLGGNLPSNVGDPAATIEASLRALEESGVRVLARSRLYRSSPLPPSPQPAFVNAVASVETSLDPAALLARLHALEAWFGRRRSTPNAARTLDLDLLDYEGRLIEGAMLTLPHPRMHERGFVLFPLAEIAPLWRHPRTGAALADLIAGLPPEARASLLSFRARA